MSPDKKPQLALIVATAALALSTAALLISLYNLNSAPDSYEECVLQKVGDVQTQGAVATLRGTCRDLFPEDFSDFVNPFETTQEPDPAE